MAKHPAVERTSAGKRFNPSAGGWRRASAAVALAVLCATAVLQIESSDSSPQPLGAPADDASGTRASNTAYGSGRDDEVVGASRGLRRLADSQVSWYRSINCSYVEGLRSEDMERALAGVKEVKVDVHVAAGPACVAALRELLLASRDLELIESSVNFEGFTGMLSEIKKAAWCPTVTTPLLAHRPNETCQVLASILDIWRHAPGSTLRTRPTRGGCGTEQLCGPHVPVRLAQRADKPWPRLLLQNPNSTAFGDPSACQASWLLMRDDLQRTPALAVPSNTKAAECLRNAGGEPDLWQQATHMVVDPLCWLVAGTAVFLASVWVATLHDFQLVQVRAAGLGVHMGHRRAAALELDTRDFMNRLAVQCGYAWRLVDCEMWYWGVVARLASPLVVAGLCTCRILRAAKNKTLGFSAVVNDPVLAGFCGGKTLWDTLSHCVCFWACLLVALFPSLANGRYLSVFSEDAWPEWNACYIGFCCLQICICCTVGLELAGHVWLFVLNLHEFGTIECCWCADEEPAPPVWLETREMLAERIAVQVPQRIVNEVERGALIPQDLVSDAVAFPKFTWVDALMDVAPVFADFILDLFNVISMLTSQNYLFALILLTVWLKTTFEEVATGPLLRVVGELRVSLETGVLTDGLTRMLLRESGLESYVSLCVTTYAVPFVWTSDISVCLGFVSIVLSLRGLAKHLYQRIQLGLDETQYVGG